VKEIAISLSEYRECVNSLEKKEKDVKHMETVKTFPVFKQKKYWDVDAQHYAPLYATIKKVCPNLRGKNVFDIGCGHGFFIHLLRELEKCKVSGIDPDMDASLIAERIGVPVAPLAIEQLPDLTAFNNLKFDLIISKDVLVLDLPVPDFNLLRAFKIAKSVLKKDGLLISAGSYKQDVSQLIKIAKKAGLEPIFDFYIHKKGGIHTLVFK